MEDRFLSIPLGGPQIEVRSEERSNFWHIADNDKATKANFSGDLAPWEEEGMACPKVSLRGKTIILLSGYRRVPGKGADADKKNPEIESLKELQISALRHPEAVAFGYVSGKWLPAA